MAGVPVDLYQLYACEDPSYPVFLAEVVKLVVPFRTKMMEKTGRMGW
jgi:hypothetical protein